jgi:hypothetical protein
VDAIFQILGFKSKKMKMLFGLARIEAANSEITPIITGFLQD